MVDDAALHGAWHGRRALEGLRCCQACSSHRDRSAQPPGILFASIFWMCLESRARLRMWASCESQVLQSRPYCMLWIEAEITRLLAYGWPQLTDRPHKAPAEQDWRFVPVNLLACGWLSKLWSLVGSPKY